MNNTCYARLCRITGRFKIWSLKLQERWREHACSHVPSAQGPSCREQPVSNIQNRRPVSWNRIRGMREVIPFWGGIHISKQSWPCSYIVQKNPSKQDPQKSCQFNQHNLVCDVLDRDVTEMSHLFFYHPQRRGSIPVILQMRKWQSNILPKAQHA